MGIDLFSIQVSQDPYSAYAELRRSGSVAHDERRGLWLVSRYADVARVLAEPEVFSNRGVSIENTLLGADSNAHARVRNIVKQAFTSARIRALEGMIRTIAQDLVDRMAVRAQCELVEDLAARLPMLVIASMLGIDDARLDDLRRGAAALLPPTTGPLTQEERRKTAEEAWRCRTFLAAHLDRAARDQRGGCVAEFLAAGLTFPEMLDIGLLLLSAGTETTTHLIGNAVLLLTRDPQLQERLRTDVGLISPFLEEVLRYESPVQRRVRMTTCATQIAGARLPKGARVVVLIGSANRDPDKFSDADHFRVPRHPNHHLAFGLGPHFCLGAQLAKLEASIVIETLMERVPGFMRAQPDDIVDFGTWLSVRGPKRLELTLGRHMPSLRP